MKYKMFAVVALMSVASFAGAQSVTVGYSQRVLDAGGQEHQNSVSVKNKISGALTGDIGVSVVQKDDTNAITNRYELGVTYNQPIVSGLSGDLRLAHGWKAKSGSAVTQYYVVEPSVTAKLSQLPLSVKVGYRIREAYDNTVADNSKTTRLALGYDLTTKDKISLGRDWQRGDGALTQTTLQYSRAF